jgi:hypothetical protein
MKAMPVHLVTSPKPSYRRTSFKGSASFLQGVHRETFSNHGWSVVKADPACLERDKPWHSSIPAVATTKVLLEKAFPYG